MSRTYKHVPYWVALARHGIETHDHSRGECTLKPESRHTSWHFHSKDACKKYTAMTVTCKHRYKVVPKYLLDEGAGYGLVNIPSYEISNKPHSVSVKNTDGTPVDFHDYPELRDYCETFKPIYGFVKSRHGVMRYERMMDILPKGIAVHTYKAYTYDETASCPGCDHRDAWRAERCDRSLGHEGHKYFRTDRDPWFDNPRNSRSVVRNSLSKLTSLDTEEMEEVWDEFVEANDLSY